MHLPFAYISYSQFICTANVGGAFFGTVFITGCDLSGPGCLTICSCALFKNSLQRKGRDRKNSNGKISDDWTAHDSSGEGWETKPLIAARRKEAGEDFWIDPKELQRENERRQAIANRIASEGEMPQEKLRSEVVAPYKQNWIGIISAFFVVLAIIAKSFPQAFELPSIGFPDLDAAGDPIPVQSTLANSARMTAERLIESIP